MEHITILPAPSQRARNEAAVWRLPQTIESEITTLAAVCQTKQPQREPLGEKKEGEIYDEDGVDDEQAKDHDLYSKIAATLSNSEASASIRMRFLDQLAELLCCERMQTM